MKASKKIHSESVKEKRNSLEISIGNILIDNYCKYGLYDDLNSYILIYEKARKNFDKVSSYLLMKLDGIKEAREAYINVLGILN